MASKGTGSARARHARKNDQEPVGHKALGKRAVATAERLIADGVLDLAASRLEETLNATKQQFDPAAKQWIEVEDYPTRLRAIELTFAHTIGLPVKRQEIITGSLDSQETLERTARKSPALLSSLRRLVDRIESEQTEEKAEKLSKKRGSKTSAPILDAEEF